ncbi:phosphotransferase [Amycolatopsis sp. YIM 10]|uniref:phosphotransferase n=1 Tax=Amycolatopsis sp. YIM 10 TaxID=2653857 RepID=UPI001290076B|nr:phosphotransferase [Amycolatopsis sp. YIM 10]QFU89230.1 Phosphotransferase enzyme family protein [Amycolatopsis sp. YIM 10]
MKDHPEGEFGLRRVLLDWGIDAVELDYAAVGFGDYHWIATGADGRRWFVTLADLATKVHCGLGVAAAGPGLRRAMDTAWELRHGGLDFVVAPEKTAGGETVRPAGEQYAVSVFPLLEGSSGDFGDTPRGSVVDLLASLHGVTPPGCVPVLDPDLALRARLEESFGELDRPWDAGPYAEPARELLAGHLPGLRRRLAEFDHRIAELSPDRVVTHGEPHPGNVLWAGENRFLLDWDTVGLAVRERDLAFATDEELQRYEELTGHRPDPATLATYRLRWDLDEVAVYVELFRQPHARTEDTGLAWAELAEIVAKL